MAVGFPLWRQHIWRRLNYAPSAEQKAAHESHASLRLVAGGERGGKSFASAMELLRRCDVIAGLFWIVGPTYDLSRPEFAYMVAALSAARVVADVSWPKSGPCSITTAWGAEIVTRSADDPVKLAGVAPHGVLMCEAAQQSYETFLRLRGRIAQTRGWLWMSGTFEGSISWFVEIFNRWQNPDNAEGGASFSLPTWSNLAVYPGGRDDPEIKRLEATYPADRFMERFAAVPCPPATLVFPEFSYVESVRPCEFDQQLPTVLAIDPGWEPGYYAVLAFQQHGNEMWQIDEVYVQRMTNAEVVAHCKQREWWPSVREAYIDTAAKTHAGAQDSALSVWQSSTTFPMMHQPVAIMDGIDRHRTFLRDSNGKRRLYHDPKCKMTIREYGLYRRPEDAEHRALRPEPVDRDNHSMKAIAYMLVNKFGAIERRAGPQVVRRSDPTGGL